MSPRPYADRAQEFDGQYREFDERGHHLADETVLAWNQGLAEVADSAQARWQLDLDAMSRWKVDRVVGMKTEPYPLVGDVVTGEAPVEQLARAASSSCAFIPPTMIPRNGPVCFPRNRGPVRFDDEAAGGIDPEGKAVTAEPVHRDGNLHVLQERRQVGRVLGIVQP